MHNNITPHLHYHRIPHIKDNMTWRAYKQPLEVFLFFSQHRMKTIFIPAWRTNLEFVFDGDMLNFIIHSYPRLKKEIVIASWNTFNQSYINLKTKVFTDTVVISNRYVGNYHYIHIAPGRVPVTILQVTSHTFCQNIDYSLSCLTPSNSLDLSRSFMVHIKGIRIIFNNSWLPLKFSKNCSVLWNLM